ncbi:bifunctional glutamate--cysteine ligase GshA/glutathione synthetase GshB [Desulfosediminicola sp.]|uniref:bifunctional glutamate--cysteine ligase GshA/glutathione synthetase GshB n=1 Tax=Desulfosediminicola sp. TaxID=2886825 RepID=UPI003AF268BD
MLDQALKQAASERLFDADFGFEKENVRVKPNGQLALTPHPSVFGDKLNHPYITTDFSESQVEMITPPLPCLSDALGFLETLHDIVATNLEDELLWPQSAPPILPEDEDIPIAEFGDKAQDHNVYRKYLAEQYGKKKQLISGIHYNFSFAEKTLKLIYQKMSPDEISYSEFKDAIYLRTLRNFKRHRWFLVAMLGTSPDLHESFGEQNRDCLGKATSIRNSIIGYRNTRLLNLNYDSYEAYKRSLQEHIEAGDIISERENYATIRLKSFPGSSHVDYLEVRLLDINPFEKTGLSHAHAQLVHIYMVYALLLPEKELFDYEKQLRSQTNQDVVACYGYSDSATIIDDEQNEIPLEQAIRKVYEQIVQYVRSILPEPYLPGLEQLEENVFNPETRIPHRLKEALKGADFVEWHINRARQDLQDSKRKNYNFHGFEDLELSTQLIMREAILRGIEIEVMDRQENFIKLAQGDHIEYVMQATRTSLDNYVSILLMENKVMTKKVLDRAGIRTPEGEEYQRGNDAQSDFELFKDKAIVIKPKSTNFGLGISIIKENNDEKIFRRAIEFAFAEDRTILIEEFIKGKEYRFFIINDQVVGILHRVPANVTGDGKSTIRGLVERKNQDPLRGKGYTTPLEKIATGEAEEIFLQAQGLNFESIPDAGKKVFLRENSNISTGGDSLDFTEDIHETYKEIAIKAAQALKVRITGLDMMILDITQEARQENYAIIEMNFNPAIHIHCHPYQGKNRRLDAKILDALGYE